jgi:glycosyltransferase involved in cell wall biosynthesis
MPRKKKILYLITKSNWGGAQKYVYDLATSLSEGTYDIAVALGGKDQLKVELERRDIRTIPVKTITRDFSIVGEIITFFRLISLLRREQPDVLHVNSSKAGGLGALAGRLTNVPRIVFTAHGWAFNEGRPWWQKKIIAILAWLTMMLSHTTLAVSRAVREDVSNFPFVQSKIKVVPLGIAPVKFRTRKDARAFLCALSPQLCHATKEEHCTWVGTIAELHPVKGLTYAIDAISSFARSGKNFVYIIMGEGEEHANLEQDIIRHDLENTVFLLGHVENAAQYLKALDIFLFPSLSEASGYAVVEAGYASLPVVASNVGGVPEIIENGISGTLVPRTDTVALERGLKNYADNPEIANAHGDKLNHHTTQAFSLPVMTAATEAWY